MPIDTIRLSKTAKDQLVKLKRKTGIKTWNVLCRWAFCRSLAEAGQPPAVPASAEYPIEMTWRTFAGEHGDVYWDLLRSRCERLRPAPDNALMAEQLRRHLGRGIAYLAGSRSLRSPEDLLSTTLTSAELD